jgi:hypothetical protein
MTKAVCDIGNAKRILSFRTREITSYLMGEKSYTPRIDTFCRIASSWSSSLRQACPEEIEGLRACSEPHRGSFVFFEFKEEE